MNVVKIETLANDLAEDVLKHITGGMVFDRCADLEYHCTGSEFGCGNYGYCGDAHSCAGKFNCGTFSSN